jgi:hypothetical protein
MPFSVGDVVTVQTGWKLRSSVASQPRRVGTILEVIGTEPRLRYRIKWHNHGRGESIHLDQGGSMRLASELAHPRFSIS